MKGCYLFTQKKHPKGEFSMRKNQSINKNCDFRMSKKENIKPYLKRRPIKRTAFNRIRSRKQ